jgi:hypothetical protein
MRKIPFVFDILFAISVAASISAAELSERPSELSPQAAVNPFTPFTGKVSKSKVRMRLGASLDSAIIRELNKGDLLVVSGETDEFYAVQPPKDLKGYIFRTYVLDNRVEGNRVNIRLGPNTESPIIGQMNSGEPVDGLISPLNNKWLEIPLPSSTRFYVAKEYLDKAGDKNFLAQMEQREKEVGHLLQTTLTACQSEFQKSFPEMNLDRIIAGYEKICKQYADFPDQAARAQDLLNELNANYLRKKIAYLERLAENHHAEPVLVSAAPAQAVETPSFPPAASLQESPEDRLLHWKSVETALYSEWAKANSGSIQEYYAAQMRNAEHHKGILECYPRSPRNKPGDYVLIHPASRAPIAFLYSTQVNLHEKLGQEVSVDVLPRSNNDFAYPAFYVVSIE